MQYKDIKGDVTAAGHEGWVELKSFKWGVGRRISSPTGAAANRESSAPTVNEIVVTKDTDDSTPKFLNEAYRGERENVQIDFCKTDGGNLEVYLTVTLEDSMVSCHTFDSNGDARPVETLRLNFTKVEVKHIPMSDTNTPGSPESIVFNVATGKVE